MDVPVKTHFHLFCYFAVSSCVSVFLHWNPWLLNCSKKMSCCQPELNTCCSFSESPIDSVSFIRQIQTSKLWVCLLECFSHLSHLFVNQIRLLSLCVCFACSPQKHYFAIFISSHLFRNRKLTFTTCVMIYFAEEMLYRYHWHFLMCYLHFSLRFLRLNYENCDFHILRFHKNVLK